MNKKQIGNFVISIVGVIMLSIILAAVFEPKRAKDYRPESVKKMNSSQKYYYFFLL